MTQVLGISNFGLLDVSTWQDKELSPKGFALADVLLPVEILGRIRTGEEAESQRVDTGLSWPAEAQINTHHALRRAPLPVLWRALVERGDRFAAWKAADGTEFSIGRMLAQSMHDLYSQAEKRLNAEAGDLSGSIPTRPQSVVAIPNALDETGQEVLLRECVGLGMPEPYLIWRPVAAALAWLKHTQPELLDLIKTEDGNDHIHVLYFGVDALEFTTLRLRRYTHNGQPYILPLRDRPHTIPQLAGMDWAGNVIETLCEPDDFGACWQLFTTFPEVWQAMAAHPFTTEELPRPWSTVNGWQFWNPSNMDAAIQDAPARSSTMLREILKPSCPLKDYAYKTTVPTQAAQEIEALTQSLPMEFLHGVVVCGPLLSNDTMKTWLSTVLGPMAKTNSRQYSQHAQLNTVWLSPGNIALAKGAAIYGERRLADIPAYLDTMPQLSLLTETAGQRKWHPLLNAQEVLGGQEFEDTIAGKFELSSGKRQLEILLCKGAIPEDSDALPSPSSDLSECQARLVRLWVRTQGSHAAVQKKYNKLEQWARDYAREVAANLFSDGETRSEQNDIQQDETDTPFRNNIINFPSPPKKNILLDVRVSIKPAAGLARVFFTPRDKEFLDGRSIRMNYATMKSCPAPRKAQRGWPALLEIAAHPSDPALLRDWNIWLIDDFEDTPPSAKNYVKLITEIQNKCLKVPYQYGQGIMFFWLYPFTEKGVCCTQAGNEQLCRIGDKFSHDFTQLLGKQDTTTIQALLSRATWLYLATPRNIVDYIRTALGHDNIKPSMDNVLIESAGKCFETEDDIRLLFEHIASKKAKTGKFPIQALRAISRLLRYREQAPNALTEKTAENLARHTIALMKEGAECDHYANKFFQGVLLLLYLLRFRRVSDYFSPQNASSMALFQEGMRFIQTSIDYFNTKKDSMKAGKATAALQDFEGFVLWQATGSYPQAVLDLAGDED